MGGGEMVDGDGGGQWGWVDGGDEMMKFDVAAFKIFSREGQG